MSIIQLKNIDKKYNENKSSEVHALKNINLEINEGDMIAIVGASGSGKSTLLHILGCLDSSFHGNYLLFGESIEQKNDRDLALIRNKKIGFVLQEYGLLLNKTALENVSIPLWFSNAKITSIKKKCMDVLRSLAMDGYSKKKVSELSGGQKQRVAIARALINDPDIILADEPTGALDRATSDEIMKEFTKLNQMGKTVIIVTHDSNISSVCNKIITIIDGQVGF